MVLSEVVIQVFKFLFGNSPSRLIAIADEPIPPATPPRLIDHLQINRDDVCLLGSLEHSVDQTEIDTDGGRFHTGQAPTLRVLNEHCSCQ